MQTPRYDVLVVGGGINGAGIARDAAGRGLSVMLCEQDDLAAHTSSASTKLIHGGLRYLEYGEYRLVRKALQEREVLLKVAPHIIGPMRFVMPHVPGLRPTWMIRAGLFLYDHLARRELLPGSRGIHLGRHPAGTPLVTSLKRGFVYSDGWVDDSRLVVLNALDAAERGATIVTRTRVVSAVRAAGEWSATLSARDGASLAVRAGAIVNAAGPWVGELLQGALRGAAGAGKVRLVKGSHIVTRGLFEHDHAYIFQNPDRRIVFAIPYEGAFTLIGTTDVEYVGDPAAVSIDDDEVRYLCESINRYFVRAIGPSDVVWSYSGVRPLVDEESGGSASAATRDYRLELNMPDGEAPLLSVFGGKITTFRKLGEEAGDRLCAALGMGSGAWTHRVPLPGGDMKDLAKLHETLRARCQWLPDDLARRYVRTYGTRTLQLIGAAEDLRDLGEEIAPGLFAAELAYLRDVEWARSAEDVLWRRTKLGLHLHAGSVQDAAERVDSWFGATSSLPLLARTG